MNLKNYLTEITEVWKRGDAREETYYSTLKTLLTDFTNQKLNKPVDVTVLPKKTVAGNPDFRIWDGNNSIIGYIEAKIPGTNLDDIEDTEQIQRYLTTFPNVIVTNFLQFRLYRNGMESIDVSIGRWNNIKTLRTAPPPERINEFEELLDRFVSYSLPAITSAEELAMILAQRTKFLRDEIIKIELPENEDIRGFYEAFTKYLIADLSEDDFADLYAQTITYGLFAARLRAGKDFNRITAYTYIPKTIGILRDIFGFVSMGALPKQMETIIDDIAGVLAVTDVKLILEQYYKSGKGSDPIIHFYETFLEKYDPRTREKRGVYYTPEPVVDFMVRSVNIILKEKFGISAGLAGDNVTLLDPAGGTLSFFTRAMEVAVDEYVKLYGEGMKKQFIKQQLLKNFFAFELMMAPYAIGHMKTSFMLEELGYQLEDDDRVQYFLTNTLEMEDLDTVRFPGLSSLSKESHLAGEVKKNTKIQIVIGNPPYSYESSNNAPWIADKVKDYYFVDGVSINEKNPKGLQDDYVKFIRFAQHKIDQAGEGVVCLITNHGYLDNPTFRGMRKSLMDSFDEIYILDLHGNALKKEKTPEGGKDENVFDIRQGVAIVILIKYNATNQKKQKKVCHSELFGTRESKYENLLSNSISSISWGTVIPQKDFYLFKQQDYALHELYYSFDKITDIFIKYNAGLYTSRDSLTIHPTIDKVLSTVKKFSKLDPETARQVYSLGEDSRDWKVELAQDDITSSPIDTEKVVKILYRPFDVMYTYYTGKSRGFICMPRKEIMFHLLKNNIALSVGRQWGTIGSQIYDIMFVSDALVDYNVFRRGGEMVFPLSLYPEMEHVFQEQTSNIKEEIVKKYKDRFSLNGDSSVQPTEVFYYIYGILNSIKYRKKYEEFLKIDFPRIPIVNNYEVFLQISGFGKELAGLHLLKHESLNMPSAKYFGNGTNHVEKIEFDAGSVQINDLNYFGPISEEVFQFTIGGYQVCHKWLKDRKGKELTLEEVQTYCKIVTALEKTIELQKEIDEVIEI